MHVRKALRKAAVTALTGLPVTGARVFDSRIFPLEEGNLPCLTVYTADESMEFAALGGLMSRSVELTVNGYARAVTEVEDVLDDIAEQVEAALTELPGAKEIAPRRIETELSDEGDMPIACISLVFDVEYHTQIGAPGVAR